MNSRRIGEAGVAGGCRWRERNTNNGREERRKGEGGDMSARRNLTTWAGAVALAWAIAGLTAAHAQTTTNVYADTTEVQIDANRHLQNAIDASGPGDTLILHGNFPWWDGALVGASGRRTTISSKTNLTLIADATDGASVYGNWVDALYIWGSSNITVAGIAFGFNNANGIAIANNCSGMQVVSNCTVRGNNTGTGMYMLSRVTVVDCTVDAGTSYAGIDVRNDPGLSAANNSLIVGNTVTNCASGILLWSHSSQAIGNTVFDCGGGISAGNWNHYAIVRSNTVYRCGGGMGNGIAIGTEYSYNVVYSNTVGIGIDPNYNASGRIGYKVHHNTVYGNGTGIRIANVQYVDYDQVAANIVVGNGTGIDFDNIAGSGGTVPAIFYSDVWNNTTDYANDAVGATKTGVVTSDPGFHSTDPAHKWFLQLGPATPSTVLTTGDDSSYGGAAYMGAIEPYFPAGTVISVQ
jgi:parallel beta-helix repeat protein